MKIRLLKPVTLESSEVPAGEIIDVSELSAGALINEGAAEATEGPTSDETPKGDLTTGNAEELEAEKLRAALDSKYKRDELADAAKEVGVEFAFDAKKAEIVSAVIAAGKSEALLA